MRGRFAHVEVRGLGGAHAAEVGEAVEAALLATPGVLHAAVNSTLGRVVVELVELGGPAELDGVLDAVTEAEQQVGVEDVPFPLGRPEHPADGAPIVRDAWAAAADLVAIGVALAGRFARLPAIPAEFAGITSLAQTYPQVRNAIATITGPTIADAGLSLAHAGAQAVAQGPLGLVADLGQRVSLIVEGRARQAAWGRTQEDLFGPGRGGGVTIRPAGGNPSREVPLRHGPVETYTDGAAVASLAAAAGTFAATSDLRRAGAAALASTPRAAGLGREAFAAHLGRVLADRDVLCLDSSALRRLDRIDTVLLDESALVTGKFAVDRIEIVAAVEASDARRRVRELFDPNRPSKRARKGEWSLRPRTDSERRADGMAAQGDVLKLRRDGEVVALVTVSPAIDPIARSLVESAHGAGHAVVVAGPEDLATRLRADLHVASGNGEDGLLSAVRMLQEDECGVALLAGADAAEPLALADLGVGLIGTAVPWTADVLVQDLSGAALVLDALTIAHDVSRQSAALALAGSAVGGVLALTSAPTRAAARAAVSVNSAAIAALANGARAAIALGSRRPTTADDHPPWHELDPDEVLSQLETPPEGLTQEEAADRLRRTIAFEDGPISFPVAVLEELANPLTPVLAGAAALSTAVGSLADAGMIGAVVGANALIGGAQRYQVERAVRRLEVQSSQRVRVRRDGVTDTVAVGELVPGDVVALSAGDSVPADCRILESTALEVDESSLTGESIPVSKGRDASLSPAVAEHTSMVYEGTVVAAGEVTAVVVATGRDTESRRWAEQPRLAAGGVEARLRDLTSVTIPAAAVAGAGIVVTGVLRGRSIPQSLHTGVSLAVAAVPEGLPILATMAQLSAARRLSARGALVRNPRAVEALGRVDLLCCDKTGTLTEGRMEVQGVFDGRTELDLTDPSGPGAAMLAAALRASPLANADDDPLPHLTDRAVVDGAARLGIAASVGVKGWRPRAELPFEPARGYHAVLGHNGRSFLLSVKGAPEVVLPRCTEWQRAGELVDLDDSVRGELDATVDALTRRGSRILAVAERRASSRADLDDGRVDRLQLLGFIALSDPVRPAAADSVATLSAAGVRTVMITGDHPSTAEGIAAELGLLNGRRVVTGPEIDAMDDTELDAVLDDTSVFARVTPTHKVRLVAAYQRQGRTVAMTGDGSNDAPAIRLADVGVALGEHSTSAARAVADVVVADGRIETLVDAIVEGRAMWASVREAIAILVGGNLGEILFTVGASALTTNALSARQLLLVNLLTDIAPSLAIAVRTPRDKRADDLLREGPDVSLGVSLDRQIVNRAIATATGAGVAWVGGRMTGRAKRASTIALVGLVGAQLGQTLVVGGRDPVVLAASFGSAAGLAAIVQTPGVSRFFGCTPLGPVGWGIGLSGAAVGVGMSLVLPPLVARVPRLADPGPALASMPGVSA